MLRKNWSTTVLKLSQIVLLKFGILTCFNELKLLQLFLPNTESTITKLLSFLGLKKKHLSAAEVEAVAWAVAEKKGRTEVAKRRPAPQH